MWGPYRVARLEDRRLSRTISRTCRQTDIEIKGTERQIDRVKKKEVDRQTTIERREKERQMDTRDKRQIEKHTDTQP